MDFTSIAAADYWLPLFIAGRFLFRHYSFDFLLMIRFDTYATPSSPFRID